MVAFSLVHEMAQSNSDKTRMSRTPMKETLNSSGRSESPASILKNRKITQHLKNVFEQSPRDLLVHHELSVNEMPGGLREAYIRGHYREPHQKFTSYLGSIFEIHNESLNIWTAILRYDTHLWLKTCFIRQLAIKDNSNWLLYFLCSLNRVPAVSLTLFFTLTHFLEPLEI